MAVLVFKPVHFAPVAFFLTVIMCFGKDNGALAAPSRVCGCQLRPEFHALNLRCDLTSY